MNSRMIRILLALIASLQQGGPGGGGVLLVQADDLEHRPGQRIGEKQVREQLGNLAQLVRVQPVHSRILKRGI